MKTIQTVVYYRGETPMRGAIVQIDRKGADDVREDVQRFTLLRWEAREAPQDMGLAFSLWWRTDCTECGETFEPRTNNYTKALPRRCKKCRKANPYNPDGWMGRPRNRYVRTDPETEAAEPQVSEPLAATDMWAMLSSAERLALLRQAKAELGEGASRDAIEVKARKTLLSLF